MVLCRDLSTRHLDGQSLLWMGRNVVDGNKIKEPKRCSKTIDIVSYALEVSVNGVTFVFVVCFRSPDTL